MPTYEDILKVNSTIKTTPIKNKEYAEVPQRIKAFRMLYPMGSIETEMISDDGNKCIFKAVVKSETGEILGTGTAFEKADSSFINQTSYIENCETSAVGRALGMCGIGIDVSVASYEEVANAINNQNASKPQPQQKDKETVLAEVKAKTELLQIINDRGLTLEAVCKKYSITAPIDTWSVANFEAVKKALLKESK